MTDDYDPAKDSHDSYYAAIEAKRLRHVVAERDRFRVALEQILDLDSTRSIWDARGIARSVLVQDVVMRHCRKALT